MKLLFDENLSDRITRHLADRYPGSSHVKHHGLLSVDDRTIWDFAAKGDFTIISKDADFHQRSLLYGHPPKFIYLRLGNCTTREILQLLEREAAVIQAFGSHGAESILVLD